MPKNIKEQISIKVPKKLEKEIKVFNNAKKKSNATVRMAGPRSGSTNVARRGGFATAYSLPRNLKLESIRKVEYKEDKLIVHGRALLDVIETPAGFPSTSGSSDTYLLSRIFLHPGRLNSRRLMNFAANYSKYKFKKLVTSFAGAVPTSIGCEILTATVKDYGVMYPKPGVSLRSWMAELHDCKVIKAFDEGAMSSLEITNDDKSYYLSLESGDLDKTFQSSLLVCANQAASSTYYGDLLCDYVVEFSNEDVQPADVMYQSAYVASMTLGTVAVDANLLSWTTTSATQITFWGGREGVYQCTLAGASWGPFGNTNYVGKNTYGAGFILSIQGVVTSGVFSSYGAIKFTVYPNFSAMVDDNPVDYTGTFTSADLIFSGQKVLDTDPVVAAAGDIVTMKEGDGKNPEAEPQTPLCGIGISVGPGVLSGLPDVVPSLDFSHGRLGTGAPGRLQALRGLSDGRGNRL